MSILSISKPAQPTRLTQTVENAQSLFSKIQPYYPIALLGVELAKRGLEYYRERKLISLANQCINIEVPYAESLFHRVIGWIFTEFKNIEFLGEFKNFFAYNTQYVSTEDSILLFPNECATFMWRGTKIEFDLSGSGQASGRKKKDNDNNYQLKFFTTEQQVAEDFLRFLHEYHAKKAKSNYIYTWTSSDWCSNNSDITERYYVVHEDVEKELICDIDKYFEHKEKLKKIGLSGKRGYALTSSAGTGKTSLVAYIAFKYKMNLAVINLNTVSDDSLIEAMHYLPKNSILLLDDFDCGGGNKNREDSNSSSSMMNVTLSGVLNALDGIQTQGDRITFLCTNFIANIDDAILRPGRCDKIIYVPVASRLQITKMAEILSIELKEEEILDLLKKESTMAVAQEFMIQKVYNS